ncbi:hypothetical protein E4T49_03357 [Aureobasidium sp. EXF-10728]|nr:hypothetical protein E4T49_03357 [Aureobasidium sp. EXF-10728]
MRDRRNTNLSISSTGSFASAHTSPVVADHSQDSAEKGRFLWIPAREDAEPLPSPLLKHARESQHGFFDGWQRTPRWRTAVMLFVLAIVLICYTLAPILTVDIQFDAVFANADKQIDLINGASIPDHPIPVIFQDQYGQPRWTVSIPPSFGFPLEHHEYAKICSTSEGVRASVEAMTGRASRIHGKSRPHFWKRPYYAADETFMPVDEAEAMNLLPAMPEGQKHISVLGHVNGSSSHLPVCQSSLTFIMETSEAGFGNTLLALWLSYGMAKKEGRTFFIDDSNWSYGRYTTYFKQPPQSACAPPPANQVLPCPHSARHLVVSAATLPWTFGSAFKAEYQQSLKHGFKKNRPIYDLVRQGYQDLFNLQGEDGSFLTHKLTVMRAAASASQTPLIGMHIRRGDLHPFEVEYSHDYLPFERYTSAASELFASMSPNKSSMEPTALLLASDDPDILSSHDLVNTLPSHLAVSRPQERIVLASKKTLEPAVPIRKPGSAYVKHVDENSGWEGGFYASLFFSLGKGHPSASKQGMGDEMQKAVLKLRELVGRAYLLDLAVVGHADGAVCASSSAGCRIIGVMMGADKVNNGQWRNVDGKRVWSWDGKV